MNNNVQLKRSLTLPLVTFYGLGNIVGAGIYVLVGKVAGHAGLFTPLSFIIASLVAALTAFTYSELSSRYPLSAGEAIYLQRSLNVPALSVLVGLLIVLAGTISAATITRGFVGYVQVLISIPSEFIVLALVIILGSVAAWGIKESVRIATVITLISIIGLVLIIIVASPAAIKAAPHLDELPSLTDLFVLEGIFVGAFLAFYAFIGFEDMVNVAEEVKDPVKVMPKAILLALIIATLLYFLIAFLCITVVSPTELARSNAPLALVYEQATGNKPVLISIISLISVVNGALIQIIMASRVLYGLSSQGWLPEIVGRVNPKTHTPIIATVFTSTLILVMALWLPIELLAKGTSFLLFIIFSMVNVALWRIKQGEAEHPEGIIKLPLWVPIAGAVTSLSFVVFQLLIELR
jgi:basic amino acid/polyamine antiporter, APA family